jgi:putative SOS response-associated peptidase YedK
VRAYLENENMPVDEELPDEDSPDAPRQSYNFAPGYYGIVYRAETPDVGAGPVRQDEAVPIQPVEQYEPGPTKYKLQSMKWGLIPFWTKRNPDYGSMMKTINCRDDSLIENRGMWNTMKQRKRCIVVAEGFYEWLKKGKTKVPHYTKRKDGQLMCFAGLWDCVQYEGSTEKLYTYTIITTDSNPQLRVLHDRMPVILENGSHDVRTWLDPNRYTWSKELQALLHPFQGELDCYPVSQEVGKVGNNSPKFIIPVDSSQNKSNIANFFTKPNNNTPVEKAVHFPGPSATEDGSSSNEEHIANIMVKHDPEEIRETVDHTGTEDNAPLPVPANLKKGVKRELEDVPMEGPKKSAKISYDSQSFSSPQKSARKTRSATSNNTASPSKGTGSQKITSFFGK